MMRNGGIGRWTCSFCLTEEADMRRRGWWMSSSDCTGTCTVGRLSMKAAIASVSKIERWQARQKLFAELRGAGDLG